MNGTYTTRCTYGTERWRQICDWLTLHDLSPEDVPIDAAVEFRGDTFTIEIYARDSNGRVMIDGGTPVRVSRPVKLIEATDSLVPVDA